MKKLMISVIGATLLPLSMAYAGTTSTTTTTTNEGFFESLIGPYYQDLELTDAQKTSISNIHEKHRLAEHKEVESVLTPEQVTKWNKLKTGRQESLLNKTEKEHKNE